MEQDVSGIGDVNGDGTDDIVWADSNGDLTAWTMKNGQYNGMLIIALCIFETTVLACV